MAGGWACAASGTAAGLAMTVSEFGSAAAACLPAAIGVASGAMMCFRGASASMRIESELRRIGGGDEAAPRTLVSGDSLSDGWNLLVAGRDSIDDRTVHGDVATIGGDTVTLVRAIRDLPAAWVVTDADGVPRHASPIAATLLGIEASSDPPFAVDNREATLGDYFTGDSRGDVDDPAEASIDADHLEELWSDLIGPSRSVRRDFRDTARERILRIHRNRMAGRDGDASLMVWTLADVTRQQAAADSKDQFLLSAAHEIRTPLQNLRAFAEILDDADEMDPEDEKAFRSQIVSETHRLSMLIDQLLAVGQMEAGSMTIHRHRLDLGAIVEEAVDGVRAAAADADATLRVDIAAKLSAVEGDRGKLQATVANLIGNAIKYCPAGAGIAVEVNESPAAAAEPADPASAGRIVVAVSDNGPGIAPEHREKVFEKFYRVGSEADADKVGNGLGLAFARQTAQLHGGDLTLTDADPDAPEGRRGCRFELSLPIAPEGVAR